MEQADYANKTRKAQDVETVRLMLAGNEPVEEIVTRHFKNSVKTLKTSHQWRRGLVFLWINRYFCLQKWNSISYLRPGPFRNRPDGEAVKS